LKIPLEEITKITKELESKTAEELLKWALENFSPKIALASSFQCEDSVLIDMLYKINHKNFRIFTLDTGRLNEETYEIMERIREKYGVPIESQFPDREAVEKLEKETGLAMQKIEVWHNQANAAELQKIPEFRQCGGVPFFINTKTKKIICGAKDYESFKKWALGK